MKLIRLTLVWSLLLLAAAPSFALPCQSCDAPDYPYCQNSPGTGYRCRMGPDWCQQIFFPECSPFTDSVSVQAEWTVASIEVRRPAEGTKSVTHPAAVAAVERTSPVVQK